MKQLLLDSDYYLYFWYFRDTDNDIAVQVNVDADNANITFRNVKVGKVYINVKNASFTFEGSSEMKSIIMSFQASEGNLSIYLAEKSETKLTGSEMVGRGTLDIIHNTSVTIDGSGYLDIKGCAMSSIYGYDMKGYSLNLGVHIEKGSTLTVNGGIVRASYCELKK